MSRSILIRHAALKVRLPITCCKCGRDDMSSIILIEVENVLPSALANINPGLGTSFPIGWAKFRRDGVDVLECPDCLAI